MWSPVVSKNISFFSELLESATEDNACSSDCALPSTIPFLIVACALRNYRTLDYTIDYSLVFHPIESRIKGK
jgi:hypothetical protein